MVQSGICHNNNNIRLQGISFIPRFQLMAFPSYFLSFPSDQRLRPPAEDLLNHPFIRRNKTTANTNPGQRNNSPGHAVGPCG